MSRRVRGTGRTGWTLHEMLVSLGVMSVAVGLAAHAAARQLRFFRGIDEIMSVRANVGDVGAIVAGVLWGISPSRGDITVATDSVLEVRAPAGAAVVCEGAPGRITIPAPEPRGAALSAFDDAPEAGDAADVMIADSAGTRWLRVTFGGGPETGGECPAFPPVLRTWVLLLREPVLVPARSILHVVRPVRLGHYRASDGLWYFGARDWNPTAGQFNTIQPVAGPLDPHAADLSTSGLVFRYYDRSGQELLAPVDIARIARVDVVARARSLRPLRVNGLASASGVFRDSAAAAIALRNAP